MPSRYLGYASNQGDLFVFRILNLSAKCHSTIIRSIIKPADEKNMCNKRPNDSEYDL